MYFEEKHKLIRKLARDFATEVFTKEVLDEIEETHEFPDEICKQLADVGFYGIKIPREWGGAGSDHRGYVSVIEELARVSPVGSVVANGPNSLVGTPLYQFGTDEQKEKYLRPLVRGEKLVVFGLTEPGAGSDAGGTTTIAVQDGDYYILNGRKCFITGAPKADYAIIFAKTDMEKGVKGITSFIMDMKSEGVSLGKPEDKMGIIGWPTSDIIMVDVKVPKENILGEKNEGFINAMKTLDVGRIGVAAQSIGIGQAALDEAVKYAKERKQFGKTLGSFQGISFMLADMATKLEAAKLLTYQAAYMKDTGQDVTKAASMAKYFASEACNEICAKALQIHGGYGYIKEFLIERLYRDARVQTIYEGTSQIQQIVISGQLLK
ncbi:acyl-CoA dehydrogenase family protein [Zhenpiania hominis]|uniref:acyl-CoA dehydrogenase family protein n=1 Tax=Zhenpiania hominis TaxID=2763644 RepID=UPI0039F4FE0A